MFSNKETSKIVQVNDHRSDKLSSVSELNQIFENNFLIKFSISKELPYLIDHITAKFLQRFITKRFGCLIQYLMNTPKQFKNLDW